ARGDVHAPLRRRHHRRRHGRRCCCARGVRGSRRVSNLAGTGVLVRLALRRDRVRLPIWVVATALLVYAQAASIVGLYPDPADLASAAELVAGNAAFIAMAG